jgi:hypothetical protein
LKNSRTFPGLENKFVIFQDTWESCRLELTQITVNIVLPLNYGFCQYLSFLLVEFFNHLLLFLETLHCMLFMSAMLNHTGCYSENLC